MLTHSPAKPLHYAMQKKKNVLDKGPLAPQRTVGKTQNAARTRRERERERERERFRMLPLYTLALLLLTHALIDY
jgi:hypothetical protein